MASPRDPSEDFVADVLRVVQTCAGRLQPEHIERIEAEIRSQYGGERVYIHREGWFNRTERDQRIRNERSGGASVRALSRKYVLSVSTVHAILGDGA